MALVLNRYVLILLTDPVVTPGTWNDIYLGTKLFYQAMITINLRPLCDYITCLHIVCAQRHAPFDVS